MTQDGSTALAIVEPQYEGITMAMSPAEALARMKELQAFVKAVMVKGVDYGEIPGTGDKPTLLQPGAQKLAEVYGFAHRFEALETVRDWDRGFFYFEVRCTLTSRRDGSFVGEGIGSCNSRESKYAGRWVQADEVPKGIEKSTLQKRTRGEWLFESKLPKGTELAKLQREERTSKRTGSKYWVYLFEVESFFTPNPDPFSLVNTLQKMACKRAYIHAVIAATRSGGTFTQDVEDLPPEVFGKASTERSWEEGKESTENAPALADQGPAHGPIAPVEDRAELARFTQRMAELETAKTLEGLKKTWAAVLDDKKRKLLRPGHVEQLTRAKDNRKRAIDGEKHAESVKKAEQDLEAMGDLAPGWGGEKPAEKEPDDGEPPPDVKLEGDDDELRGRM